MYRVNEYEILFFPFLAPVSKALNKPGDAYRSAAAWLISALSSRTNFRTVKFRLEIVVINEAFTKRERDGVTEAYTHALVQTQK